MKEAWKYPVKIEEHMKELYRMLSEKDRRLYAAIEAQKLPRGGLTYIAGLFGCDPKTIRRGIRELQESEMLPQGRIRNIGGGRQRKMDSIPDLDEIFLTIVQKHTEIDSADHTTRWTSLPYKEIARRLQRRGIDVSERIVKQLFQKHKYKKRSVPI
jgi:MarR-like DNA-binding transcriptional regulator SgrR of sgrS sRNA